MCGLFSPNFFSFSFFFSLKKDQKKRRSQKRRGVQPFFFVWNFALSSVVSSDFCLKIKKKKAHTNPTMRRRGCARTRHHNDRPRSPSLRPSLCGHFFVPQKKYIYIYPLGKHTMMHHATCQSITARTAALLATKRQLKNRRNASSVIVRAQEFIATDKAPAAAGPYSQGIKVRLGRF